MSLHLFQRRLTVQFLCLIIVLVSRPGLFATYMSIMHTDDNHSPTLEPEQTRDLRTVFSSLTISSPDEKKKRQGAEIRVGLC